MAWSSVTPPPPPPSHTHTTTTNHPTQFLHPHCWPTSNELQNAKRHINFKNATVSINQTPHVKWNPLPTPPIFIVFLSTCIYSCHHSSCQAQKNIQLRTGLAKIHVFFFLNRIARTCIANKTANVFHNTYSGPQHFCPNDTSGAGKSKWQHKATYRVEMKLRITGD